MGSGPLVHKHMLAAVHLIIRPTYPSLLYLNCLTLHREAVDLCVFLLGHPPPAQWHTKSSILSVQRQQASYSSHHSFSTPLSQSVFVCWVQDIPSFEGKSTLPHILRSAVMKGLVCPSFLEQAFIRLPLAFLSPAGPLAPLLRC